MTTYAASRAFDEPDGRDLSPAEGWTAVALLVVMLLAVGIAVDSARWVGTTVAGESRTGFLPLVLLAGAAWGFVGAKSKLPAALVHVIGAVIGTLLVIVLVAGVNSTAAELSARLAALSASLDRFGVDPPRPPGPLDRDGAVPARDRLHRLGDRRLRRLRGLPPSPADGRPGRPRAVAPGEPLADLRVPLPTPRRLCRGRAPAPRPGQPRRAAQRLAPAPDRRCRPRLGPLHAQRPDLRGGRRHRRRAPDVGRQLGPPGRLLAHLPERHRRRRPAAQPVGRRPDRAGPGPEQPLRSPARRSRACGSHRTRSPTWPRRATASASTGASRRTTTSRATRGIRPRGPQSASILALRSWAARPGRSPRRPIATR